MTDAAKSLAAQRTPEKVDAGLISPMFDMHAGDLYAELLERLDMESFVLHADEPRSHLVVTIEALGHCPVFPYHPRTSLPLAMNLDCFLDDNVAIARRPEGDAHCISYRRVTHDWQEWPPHSLARQQARAVNAAAEAHQDI